MSVNRLLDKALGALWTCMAAVLAVACSGAPAADTDAAASAAADSPVFSFADALGTDGQSADADSGVDATDDADAAPDDALTGEVDGEADGVSTGDAAATDATVADDGGADAATDAEDTGADDAADMSPDAGCVPSACPQPDAPCTVAVCLSDGSCGSAIASDGQKCSDGNACTANDSCQTGTCIGAAINCDDANLCTIDSCKATSGCIHQFQIAPCEDGDGCTLKDQCVSGVCTAGAPVVCTTTDPCQQAGSCEPATGACSVGALPNGTSCGANQVCMVGVCSVADALPAGALAWFNTADCPVGWDAESLANGRTIVPADSDGPGEDGSPLTPGEIRLHSHSIVGTITTGSVSFAGIVSCCNSGLTTAGTWDVTGSADPASSGIPYVQLRGCRKSTAIVYGQAPTGLVAFVDSTCPNMWSAVLVGIHRYIVGTPNGGTTGATFGGTWGSAHSHAISFDIPLASHGIALASGCCGGGFGASGNVAFSSTSAASVSDFPSMRRTACTPIASSGAAGPIPSGLVAFFTTGTCPTGWSVASSVAGRLVVGTGNGSNVGAQIGQALADQEDRGHSHSVLLSVQPPSKSISGGNGTNGQGADSGKAEATGVSATAKSGMPFVQWLACQKD